ncbi:MAG: hypothetical protein RQ753_10520, partial [Desulfurivibrionaceae bacterium]|nr:hypothetical protein [Desulfurivibrionaceae bacterium]
MTEKFHYKSVLGRKLILYVMLFSISIIVIGASFVLYLDYSEDRDHLDYVVSQIKTSQLPSVIKSLWVAD